MPPPKDLPGFYYDAQKNRYFPIKGPIPGSKRAAPPPASLAACSSSSTQENKIQVIRKPKRIKASQLLRLREIQGRDIVCNSSRYVFHKRYEEILASQPTVWKFDGTKNVCSAIERISVQLQTETGIRDGQFLAIGRAYGTLSFFQIDNPEGSHLDVESVWSPHLRNEASSSAHCTVPSLSIYQNARFPSEISCIKLRGDMNGYALVTTLGSGVSKGSLYSLDANIMLNFPRSASSLGAECLFQMDGTVWTADCNSAGTHAVLGTSAGSAVLDLEARTPVWIYRGKSDVLSQQFISSGNVVLCGLRNGSILMVDKRDKQINNGTEASGWSRAVQNPYTRNLPQSRRERRRSSMRPQVDGRQKSTSHVQMTSSVCSMVSLSSDENYFLASSMDGSIKLFDIRAAKNEGVQSYKGHVNAHTNLQLVVNPSETLLLSGGEDCRVRIWSIKTGELLFSESFSESSCNVAFWPDLQDYAGHRLDETRGAWLGSRNGLYYMQGI